VIAGVSNNCALNMVDSSLSSFCSSSLTLSAVYSVSLKHEYNNGNTAYIVCDY